MPPLLSMLLSLSDIDVGGTVSRGTRRFGILLVALIFSATAYVAGVSSAALYLAERMPVWKALAWVAAGSALAALLVLGAGGMLARSADRQAKEIAGAKRAAMLGSLAGLSSGHSGKTLLAAALAGLVAGGMLHPKKDSDT